MSTFMHKIHAFIALVSLAPLLCALSAQAQPEFIGGDLGMPATQESHSLIDSSDTDSPPSPNYSPAEAADRVRAKVGGQIINVSTHKRDSGVIYNVKVLNSGRMKIIRVDGQTGQLLNE